MASPTKLPVLSRSNRVGVKVAECAGRRLIDREELPCDITYCLRGPASTRACGGHESRNGDQALFSTHRTGGEAMPIFDRRLTHVKTRVWDTTPVGFKFPELSDDELKVGDVVSRPNVGVAFSGGGTRSAAATLGQLRGLSELGLINSIRYISCVSGGAWACVPFTFLPDSWTDEQFLGQPVDPADISLPRLSQTDRNSYAHSVANSVIFDDFIEKALKLAGDETYARAIGDVFLEGFRIDSLSRFFTQDRQSRDAILGRNSRMRADDFYLSRRSRPFLIVGSTLLRVDNEPPEPDLIHVETTPLYAGAHVRHSNAGSSRRAIGGGYVEPFAFDSDAPDRAPTGGEVSVRLGAKRHRYTLSDVMGTTGAAPAEALERLNLSFLGFPEFKHWPVPDANGATTKEYEFGDGGHLENLGIMPLLMRRVEKIVVFINTRDELKPDDGKINTSLPPLFGQTPQFTKNHVFPKSKYRSLVDGLVKAKDAGKTVMFRDKYTVSEALHYGVKGGWKVEVLWVYNERVPDWESELRREVRDEIASGSLGSFPHYRTFFQNPPSIIDLSAKQVHMLAHLSCWNVTKNAQVFRKMLLDG